LRANGSSSKRYGRDPASLRSASLNGSFEERRVGFGLGDQLIGVGSEQEAGGDGLVG